MYLGYYYKSTVCFGGLRIMKEVSEITAESVVWMTQETPLEDKPQIITGKGLSSCGIVNLCKKSEYVRAEMTLRV